MSEYKETNFKAEKSTDESRMVMSYHATLEAAKNWVGSSSAFRIVDEITGLIALEQDAAIFDKIAKGKI